MLHIRLNWKEIYKVANDTTLDNLLDQHSELFEPGLGKLKHFKAKIHVDPQAKPWLWIINLLALNSLRDTTHCWLHLQKFKPPDLQRTY